MANKFLAFLGGAKGAPSSTASKIGLGLGASSLGISIANFSNNKEAKKMEAQRLHLERDRVHIQEEQKNIDQRSLRALSSINRALAVKPV